MRFTFITRLLLAVVLLAALAAVAQKPAEHSMPKYDVKSEVTIKGTIEGLEEMPMAKGEVGLHLTIKTSSETIEVRTCPTGFLKEVEATFAKGQEIQVTGSRVKIDDKDVILAREIVNGNNTLVLRDKEGTPVWTWLKKG